MTDKELVERAAMAAGYSPSRVTDDGVVLLRGIVVNWNPLLDNGDALRLAVALKMDLHIDKGHAFVRSSRHEAIEDFDSSDPMSATRRAIVRAAAGAMHD